MNRLTLYFISFLIVLFVASGSLYIVKQTEGAVKLRFGKLVETDIQPGLHVKWPFADNIRIFDTRVLTLDSQQESFFTSENKRLIVDSYAKWRVVDVNTYYVSTGGSEDLAVSRLANRINSGLRNEFGVRTLHEVVSGQRDLLMADLKTSLNQSVHEELGIEVVDVRVKRIDLPPEVSEPVFRRMKAEREKEARELRAKGGESSKKIHALADRGRTVLLAEAYSEAEQIRGAGDAEATLIYANAYQQDAELYSFVRSLNAYQQSFNSKNDILLLDPKGDFFKYLNNSKVR